jgi:hypothetical protein
MSPLGSLGTVNLESIDTHFKLFNDKFLVKEKEGFWKITVCLTELA